MTCPLRYSVAVFAHSEGELLRRAVESVLVALADEAAARVYLLVNGSRNRTLEVARALGAEDSRVRAVDIDLGDKCHAWNLMVHEVSPEAEAVCFLDGDCWCSPGALSSMHAALQGEDAPNAIAGLPLTTGAGSPLDRHVREEGWVFGPLYAMSGRHLGAIRRSGVRLPVGLYGNDHFITRILRASPELGDERRERVSHREGAGFEWERASPWRVSSVMRYLRQQRRYRWRAFQLTALRGVGLTELPRTMDAINLEILRAIHAREGLVVPPDVRTPRSPSRHSVYDRWVAAALERLYGDPPTAYYERKLQDSTWRFAEVAPESHDAPLCRVPEARGELGTARETNGG